MGSFLSILVAYRGLVYSCKDCVVGYFETCQEQGKDGMCPICSSGPVKEGDLLEVILEKESDAGEGESKPKVVIRKNDFVSSTKIDALIRNLRKSSGPFRYSILTRRLATQDGSEIKTPISALWCSPNSRHSLT
jgi:hypothetical protein